MIRGWNKNAGGKSLLCSRWETPKDEFINITFNLVSLWVFYLLKHASHNKNITDHEWWTDEDSSRCSSNSFPSSFLVCTDSLVMGWTGGRTLRWHTGFWHPGPVSCFHCRPHTAAEYVGADYKFHPWSTSLLPPNSRCRPVKRLTELLGRT